MEQHAGLHHHHHGTLGEWNWSTQPELEASVSYGQVPDVIFKRPGLQCSLQCPFACIQIFPPCQWQGSLLLQVLRLLVLKLSVYEKKQMVVALSANVQTKWYTELWGSPMKRILDQASKVRRMHLLKLSVRFTPLAENRDSKHVLLALSRKSLVQASCRCFGSSSLPMLSTANTSTGCGSQSRVPNF